MVVHVGNDEARRCVVMVGRRLIMMQRNVVSFAGILCRRRTPFPSITVNLNFKISIVKRCLIANLRSVRFLNYNTTPAISHKLQ